MSIIKREKTIHDINKDNIRYAVFYDGYLQHFINPDLVISQGIVPESDQFEQIKEAQVERLRIFERMEQTNNEAELSALDALFTINEFNLQKLWGFPENEDHHKFWEAPQCTCPKIDNNDAYPTGYYSINSNCPVHKHRIEGRT